MSASPPSRAQLRGHSMSSPPLTHSFHCPRHPCFRNTECFLPGIGMFPFLPGRHLRSHHAPFSPRQSGCVSSARHYRVQLHLSRVEPKVHNNPLWLAPQRRSPGRRGGLCCQKRQHPLAAASAASHSCGRAPTGRPCPRRLHWNRPSSRPRCPRAASAPPWRLRTLPASPEGRPLRFQAVSSAERCQSRITMSNRSSVGATCRVLEASRQALDRRTWLVVVDSRCICGRRWTRASPPTKGEPLGIAHTHGEGRHVRRSRRSARYCGHRVGAAEGPRMYV